MIGFKLNVIKIC